MAPVDTGGAYETSGMPVHDATSPHVKRQTSENVHWKVGMACFSGGISVPQPGLKMNVASTSVSLGRLTET